MKLLIFSLLDPNSVPFNDFRTTEGEAPPEEEQMWLMVRRVFNVSTCDQSVIFNISR